ncbi:MAG: hypothetical protein DCC75_00875 [Proteobacteria bacterium]|nr:MAG: hypothetical protein DCC75_00875 [Pseudomonadota bacterium]
MRIEAIKEARERIRPYTVRTPLVEAGLDLIRELKFPKRSLYLKCDNFQVTRSFKPRGAFNALLTLDPQEAARGVITRSSGNFAQALAYASSVLGIDSTIVMPTNAPKVKRESTQRYCQKVVYAGSTANEGDAEVERLARERGMVKLSPFNHPAVIAGQGVAALEILEDLPDLELFLCPVGGGGLLSGCAAALANLKPGIKIIAVEPEGGNDFFLSFQSKKKVSLSHIDTIADGLRTPTVGDLNWPILLQYVHEVITVSDQAIVAAMKLLYRAMGLVIEPSGAASLAALIGTERFRDQRCVCMLSGGNVDLTQFEDWIKGTLAD